MMGLFVDGGSKDNAVVVCLSWTLKIPSTSFPDKATRTGSQRLHVSSISQVGYLPFAGQVWFDPLVCACKRTLLMKGRRALSVSGWIEPTFSGRVGMNSLFPA